MTEPRTVDDVIREHDARRAIADMRSTTGFPVRPIHWADDVAMAVAEIRVLHLRLAAQAEVIAAARRVIDDNADAMEAESALEAALRRLDATPGGPDDPVS